MKNRNIIQRFKLLAKCLRIAVLIAFGCLFINGCVSPSFVSTPSEDRQKVAKIATLNLPTEIKIVPTATVMNTATPTPEATYTPVPTETLTVITTELNSCLSDNAKVETAKVIKIVDGDTIEVDIAGNQFSVRYIGIDTPETSDPNSPVQFYGPEANDRNSELVMGKDVILVKDVSETDRFDRLLRYVFINEVFVNEVLVTEGYAVAKEYPPDTACHIVLSTAQDKAKSGNVGLWMATPTIVVRATEIPITSNCPDGCTTHIPGCDIKGNINRDGVKIYHTPASRSYEKTEIDPSYGERWFCTAEEAIANGWRAPKN